MFKPAKFRVLWNGFIEEDPVQVMFKKIMTNKNRQEILNRIKELEIKITDLKDRINNL